MQRTACYDATAVPTKTMSADAIGNVMQTLRRGGAVLIVDERRDRGDLVAAGQLISKEVVNLMCVHGRGLVAVAITAQRARDLQLERQPVGGHHGADEDHASAFVAVEARGSVTTGISAADRALTIATVADPGSRAEDLAQPGHVLPTVARPGGLLEHLGRAEAAVDAVRLAGLRPAAALCEVLDEDGDLAGRSQLEALGRDLDLPLATIRQVSEARFEGEWGR